MFPWETLRLKGSDNNKIFQCAFLIWKIMKTNPKVIQLYRFSTYGGEGLGVIKKKRQQDHYVDKKLQFVWIYDWSLF